jgi:hypothetical protein
VARVGAWGLFDCDERSDHADSLTTVAKTFQKLSARLQGLPVTEVLHEGVPDHLEQPLRSWVYRALQGGGAGLVAVVLKLRIDYRRAEGDAAKYLASISKDDLLDVVDAILQQGGPWPKGHDLDFADEQWRRDRAILGDELDVVLDTGSSFLRVNDERDGLTRRVDATVTAAFTSAVAAADGQAGVGSAADQIRDAWRELYGVQPNPSAAYSAAIKAVESAAHATIEPNNSKATMGTMIGALKSTPHKFELALPGPSGGGGIDILTGMMELLWTGQTSRHGAQTITRAETQEQADMAVHLAVTLVHWFSTAAVVRKP